MPTDLLFEYDSSTLKPEAAASLAKLGTLIARNSGSTFRIEGHTDSFGSDDYNNALSLRRAEEVRGWLQTTAGISPGRITTAGLGKTRLLVPATGSVLEQQLNRRVEIVITASQR
jgi:outer membrane protein OmpA-like peptidoglycan-associated protein